MTTRGGARGKDSAHQGFPHRAGARRVGTALRLPARRGGQDGGLRAGSDEVWEGLRAAVWTMTAKTYDVSSALIRRLEKNLADSMKAERAARATLRTAKDCVTSAEARVFNARRALIEALNGKATTA